MTTPLIRPEIFAARRAECLGEVRVALPPVTAWLSRLSVVSAMLLMLLLCLGSYTRHASVAGEIVPVGGLLRLDASAAGVVSELRVTEGSAVKRGQTLMLIDVGQRSAAFGDTGAQVARQLLAQAARVDRNAELATVEVERSRRALHDEAKALDAERLLIAAQRALKARQLEQAVAARARIAPLAASGVLARRQAEEYEQAVLDAENALNEVDLRLLAQQRRQREVVTALAAKPAEIAARDMLLGGERGDLAQTLAETEARRVLRVLAPSDGVVSGLAVQLGQGVDADHRLLTLVPAASPLVAQLWVPSSAVGALAVGDVVMLRLDAFPYQQHGRVAAVIEQIAGSALGPDEIRRIADRAPDYPAFRVVARLRQSPARLPLRASMSLAGDLQLERRRLIQWLYAPLRAASQQVAP